MQKGSAPKRTLPEKDKAYVGRDWPAIPVAVVGSKGSYLYGSDGRKYIDFFAGWCVGNVGWGVPEILRERRKFEGPDYVNPYFLYEPWAELAELLARITPGNLLKSFRATGGTEAVEIALQAAMAHTKRHKFVSIEGSYHGHSIGAMSVGSSDFRLLYKNLLPDCHKIKPPLDAAAGKEVEKILSNGDVAAFICEPIICNLGVVVPEADFFTIAQSACKKYGTLFIADEVSTGFGRTGKLFASEHYNLKPDILCLAKALTGGYSALGVAITTEEVAKSMEFDFSFYSTFGWHPLSVKTAIANLRFILRRKESLLRNVVKLSKYFESRLRKIQFKSPANIRVKGLAIGVQFEQDGYATEIATRCLQEGLLVADFEPHTFTLFPPLTIDAKTARKGLDIIEKCL